MTTAGDRIKLVHTNDPVTKLRPGDAGTVRNVRLFNGEESINVRWDSGSSLSLFGSGGDRWQIIASEEDQ